MSVRPAGEIKQLRVLTATIALNDGRRTHARYNQLVPYWNVILAGLRGVRTAGTVEHDVSCIRVLRQGEAERGTRVTYGTALVVIGATVRYMDCIISTAH